MTLQKKIKSDLLAFVDKIASIKVLDPACGSGNFLYVALRLLLDLQNEVLNFSDEIGMGRPYITVTPAQLFGIETNEYAHELAQMTIQIGYIQWLRDNGYGFPNEPILKQTQNIKKMDAILAPSAHSPSGRGTSPKSDDKNLNKKEKTSLSDLGEAGWGHEPEWQAVDVIIGNPPFLGDKKMRSELGDEYVDALRKLYEGRIPGQSDLVCYFFEKARAMLEEGKVKRVGLLATQGIRGGANRKVLEKIKETGDIFFAYSDREWILDGATVHVSLIGFDKGRTNEHYLDDKQVTSINADLSSESNLTTAKPLEENFSLSFVGPSPHGSFDIEPDLAKEMLNAPVNVNKKLNSDVIRPVVSAIDLGQSSRNMWTIDFRLMPIEEAAMYEKPFEYLKKHVYPIRSKNRRAAYAEKWWQYAEARPGMRSALIGLSRYIATPRVSKHRIFVWLAQEVLANDGTIVFARDDDYFFGVLHSKIHELWARRTGTQLREAESGFRYTPTSTFETFPFPFPLNQEPKNDSRVQAISQAAKELVEQRDRWLNPHPSSPKSDNKNSTEIEKVAMSDLGEVPAKAGGGGKRTLTNLYNQRPTWLELAHKKLDDAVFAAYGWKNDLSDEEILEKLLALNLERSTQPK